MNENVNSIQGVIPETKQFFVRNNNINTGIYQDREKLFPVSYDKYIFINDGNGNIKEAIRPVCNRFVNEGYPNVEIFTKLFASILFKENVEDTASATQSGHVRVGSLNDYNNSVNIDINGNTLILPVSVLKSIIDGVVSTLNTNINNAISGINVGDASYSVKGVTQYAALNKTEALNLNTNPDNKIITAYELKEVLKWYIDIVNNNLNIPYASDDSKGVVFLDRVLSISPYWFNAQPTVIDSLTLAAHVGSNMLTDNNVYTAAEMNNLELSVADIKQFKLNFGVALNNPMIFNPSIIYNKIHNKVNDKVKGRFILVASSGADVSFKFKPANLKVYIKDTLNTTSLFIMGKESIDTIYTLKGIMDNDPGNPYLRRGMAIIDYEIHQISNEWLYSYSVNVYTQNIPNPDYQHNPN